ncbi:hypothetical protein DUNSADRAFT_6371 [Dunaliella salina]|uniref:Uncharacterized protein n=1 Tax=Dunaliella salina TaxID=3046 RepID=A0ABQ7GNG2_DUNSA|nr:hypothetical protein DUNSADRAFT_6371 [Dunaliella salina]|eukprot:KAF5836118.1 hypothetical protein DUNSADRAFT_6371 [Dunaliella salina]
MPAARTWTFAKEGLTLYLRSSKQEMQEATQFNFLRQRLHHKQLLYPTGISQPGNLNALRALYVLYIYMLARTSSLFHPTILLCRRC